MLRVLWMQVASKPYKLGGTGGQFDLYIKQGAPAPQQATKTYTTVVDGQTMASIVVVTKCKDRPDGVVLGFFSLDGIQKVCPSPRPSDAPTCGNVPDAPAARMCFAPNAPQASRKIAP